MQLCFQPRSLTTWPGHPIRCLRRNTRLTLGLAPPLNPRHARAQQLLLGLVEGGDVSVRLCVARHHRPR
eukprot:1182958-Prorocentrum_minimum.AAC.5